MDQSFGTKAGTCFEMFCAFFFFTLICLAYIQYVIDVINEKCLLQLGISLQSVSGCIKVQRLGDIGSMEKSMHNMSPAILQY